MATYSLSIAGASAHNIFQPKNQQVEDAYANTPQKEQQTMSNGSSFLIKGPDGGSYRHVYDAERSIPGVLRVTRRV